MEHSEMIAENPEQAGSSVTTDPPAATEGRSEICPEAKAEGVAGAQQRIECLIHIRFAPNGTVTEIGERPAGVEAQRWFSYLSRHTAGCYQALSGGRGLFRIARPEVDALKAACRAEQAS